MVRELFTLPAWSTPSIAWGPKVIWAPCSSPRLRLNPVPHSLLSIWEPPSAASVGIGNARADPHFLLRMSPPSRSSSPASCVPTTPHIQCVSALPPWPALANVALMLIEHIVSHFSHLRTGVRRGEEDPRFASSLPSYNIVMQQKPYQDGHVTIVLAVVNIGA